MRATDHPDKIKLTFEILVALRKAIETVGEKAIKEYSHLGGEDAMDAFEDATGMLQMAVQESKKMAKQLKKADLLDILNRFHSQKKSPYNQT